jgi:hypothetical protein
MSNWEKGNSAYCFDCCIIFTALKLFAPEGLICLHMVDTNQPLPGEFEDKKASLYNSNYMEFLKQYSQVF